MAVKRIIFSDIDLKKLDDIIDVRSPSEYEVDHIPGAINLPVLSDKEREMIGTISVSYTHLTLPTNREV